MALGLNKLSSMSLREVSQLRLAFHWRRLKVALRHPAPQTPFAGSEGDSYAVGSSGQPWNLWPLFTPSVMSEDYENRFSMQWDEHIPQKLLALPSIVARLGKPYDIQKTLTTFCWCELKLFIVVCTSFQVVIYRKNTTRLRSLDQSYALRNADPLLVKTLKVAAFTPRLWGDTGMAGSSCCHTVITVTPGPGFFVWFSTVSRL